MLFYKADDARPQRNIFYVFLGNINRIRLPNTGNTIFSFELI